MTAQPKTWEPDQPFPTNRGRVLGLLAAPVFVTLTVLLIIGYQSTLTRVSLTVDGETQTLRTHQTTVEAVLREAGLALYPEDVVIPALSEQLTPGTNVTVYRSRPVLVQVDGRTIEARTRSTTTDEVLAELGLQVNAHDEVQRMDSLSDESPIQIHIKRAVPVTVQEAGSPPLHLYTTADTIGEALYEAGIILYLADNVRPAMSSAVKPGTRIAIERSVPVTIQVDGRTLRMRTHRYTVGDVLADLGVSLQGMDYAQPALNAPMGDGQEIRVVRVREEIEIQQEPIPFQTQWAPDPELALDSPQRIGQEGRPGVFERRIRVRYEDNAEVDRWVEAEWMAQAPQPKIVNYGTKVVLRTLNTPTGQVQYWRKVRMFATSYNAASAGKSPDHPRYGITRLGWQMRFGIVAVDPGVISLGSKVYVPGYGIGDAADTGGAIRGLRIDLGYDDDNLVSWYRCVDVYLLAPVPENIDYVSALYHPRCQ